jgi:uncharacterized protein HemY
MEWTDIHYGGLEALLKESPRNSPVVPITIRSIISKERLTNAMKFTEKLAKLRRAKHAADLERLTILLAETPP